MLVYVINKYRKPLMPCSPRKARKLLEQKKARIVRYEPFTIQLLYGSSGYKQDTTLGIDLGSRKVGLAALAKNGKILFLAELELRQDISHNLLNRRQLRRSRRNRKTRYRPARFKNRRKPANWLPPSLSSKIQAILRNVDLIGSIIPVNKIVLEVAKFDIQKLQQPKISGKQYQQGQRYGYYNTRFYVLARDNYTCQICKKKDNRPLVTHHIIPRIQGGSDRPNNLIPLHNDCHIEFHQGKHPNIKFNTLRTYKPAAQVNAMKSELIKLLQQRHPIQITFGYITAVTRQQFNLPKSHYNDAIAITGICPSNAQKDLFKIRQARKKKRSLHEQIPRKGRKTPNRQAIRNKKNSKSIIVRNKKWCLHDKVFIPELHEIGFISGFTGKQVYVQDIDGNYLQTSDKYKQISTSKLSLICRNNNYLMLKERFS